MENRSRHQSGCGFGSRRTYYCTFASHLLNAYNPNMLYPDLQHRWSDEDWRGLLGMIRAFGFNTIEFWLVPRLFCREGLDSDYGRYFLTQIRTMLRLAKDRDMDTVVLCSLATVGAQWRTLCPNDEEDWREIRYLWRAWAELLADIDVVSIFPGDPGACNRNGCTAETYIDRANEIALLVRGVLPGVEIELGT